MSLGTILTRVPWKHVIAVLPSIVKTARGLMNSQQSAPASGGRSGSQELVWRVEQLEGNERLQADLVKRMAENQQGLAEGLQFVAARINALIWLAAVALIFALTSLILVLLR